MEGGRTQKRSLERAALCLVRQEGRKVREREGRDSYGGRDTGFKHTRCGPLRPEAGSRRGSMADIKISLQKRTAQLQGQLAVYRCCPAGST